MLANAVLDPPVLPVIAGSVAAFIDPSAVPFEPGPANEVPPGAPSNKANPIPTDPV